MSVTKVVTADEQMVGFSVVTTQATFKRLLKLSGEPDMESWSKVITKLIEARGG